MNYPIVKWPTGELPVDRVVERPLEGGPLLLAPDTERMLVNCPSPIVAPNDFVVEAQ